MILKFLIIIFLFDIFNSKETKSETFSLLNSYQLLPGFENECLIKKLNVQNNIKCLSLCINENDCQFTYIDQNGCRILNKKAIRYFNITRNGEKGPQLYYKKADTFDRRTFLMNYWSFDNNSLNDSVGGANLYGGVNASFTNDRFNNSSSAIGLYSGYYQIPPGVYFYGGEFTVMAWVKPRSYGKWQRLVEFGNGPRNDNIICALNDKSPSFGIYYQSNSSQLISNLTVDLNIWKHLACVLSGNTQQIYINATLSGSIMSPFKPRIINRSINYFGKSNWVEDAITNADIDDLKIFNKALSQFEIEFEMFNNIL